MRLLIAALVCVAVLVGCGPTGAQTPSPSPSPSAPGVTPTPTPSPSPTPTPTAFASFPADLPTEDPETTAVIEGWQEYWRVYEKYAADPAAFEDFSGTRAVATGEEGERVIGSLNALKESGIRVIGSQEFRDVTVSEVSLRADRISEATVSYCVDGSRLVRLDAESGEPTGVEVPPTYLEQARMELALDGVWRVAQIRNQRATC